MSVFQKNKERFILFIATCLIAVEYLVFVIEFFAFGFTPMFKFTSTSLIDRIIIIVEFIIVTFFFFLQIGAGFVCAFHSKWKAAAIICGSFQTLIYFIDTIGALSGVIGVVALDSLRYIAVIRLIIDVSVVLINLIYIVNAYIVIPESRLKYILSRQNSYGMNKAKNDSFNNLVESNVVSPIDEKEDIC